MPVPAAVQIRVTNPTGTVKNWTLPAWVLGGISYTVSQALGFEPSVVINPRVAREMKILEGDDITFEIVENGMKFTKPVVVKECAAPVTIHGAALLGLIESESVSGTGSSLKFHDGSVLSTQMQELWAGMKVVGFQGGGVLTFDAVVRGDTSGPAGYGYMVSSANKRGIVEKPLVKGYGYYPSRSQQQTEYQGLFEGLSWALQLDFEKLCVRGPSEKVIRQCQGVYDVTDESLQRYHSKVMELVQDAEDVGIEIVFERIPRDTITFELATLATELKSHATACNWLNINEQCKR